MADSKKRGSASSSSATAPKDDASQNSPSEEEQQEKQQEEKQKAAKSANDSLSDPDKNDEKSAKEQDADREVSPTETAPPAYNADGDRIVGPTDPEFKSEEDAPEPGDDDYSPYKDPDVPSTSLADVIAVELESGDSPTLNALKDAKADEEKQNENK